MKGTGAVCMILWLVAGVLFSKCGGRGPEEIDTVATPIAEVVNRIHVAESYYNRKVQLKTNLFYRANEYRRGWLKKKRPDKMFDSFVKEVKESSRYGFNPEDYQIDSLEKQVTSLYDNRKRQEADISELDIRITASFFLFTTHLLEGRIRYPGARDFLWKRGMPLENDIALLINTESGTDLNKYLEGLHPTDPQYERLQQALKKYRRIALADSLPALRLQQEIKPGDTDPMIPLVRKKINAINLESDKQNTAAQYDSKLEKALKDFQERHGLEPSGVITEETVKFLNQPLAQKAELIALNLERLRWRPHLAGKGDEIVINVPEYMLRIYKDNKERIKMRVVLGAEYTPTPVFHDTLKYLVFSPTWMVPKSIFTKEFLPKLRDNPEYYNPDRFRFFKDGKEVDPYEEPWNDEDLDTSAYSVLENPGEANSLGKVKFIMPNDFSIYLHDTPADKLFSSDQRALSHGCIRLERPEELALYLLSDKEGWDKQKIRKAMEADKPQKVDLDKPYPVYIVYRTVWVDDEGRVHFRPDIYGHDSRQLARLGNQLALAQRKAPQD